VLADHVFIISNLMQILIGIIIGCILTVGLIGLVIWFQLNTTEEEYLEEEEEYSEEEEEQEEEQEEEEHLEQQEYLEKDTESSSQILPEPTSRVWFSPKV